MITPTAAEALLAATSSEGIAVAVAVVAATAAALSALIAAWQGIVMKQSERKRTQPVVVVYERDEPRRQGSQMLLSVSLANEGVGSAFNLRFGVEAAGELHTYQAKPAGPHGFGDVPRALGPGRTLPEDGKSYTLGVEASLLADPSALVGRIYWCRYENAFGDTWESRNAWRVDKELAIRRL